jgi:branched-chain amino acid transport system substrate-binding protein
MKTMRYVRSFIFFAVVILFFCLGGRGSAQEIVIGYTGPLSGPAAEYGQDIFNGIEMAVKEINAAGGVKVAGKKQLFRLEKLDDRVDPTQAVNNARRFKNNGAIAVFNGVFNTIAPIMKINEEKGNEFLMLAYTSTPKVNELKNKLMVTVTVSFTPYVEAFTAWAIKKGYRKCAIVCTLGAYGDEWRSAFKAAFEKKGGKVTIEKPANYYTETDFSAPLTAAMATKPDCMLIGGPSATTALVIEQARQMGYKGAFILIDQAKQDYIEKILKGTKLMGNLIGTAGVLSLPPTAGSTKFANEYLQTYKRMVTWECALNYTAVFTLAKAIEAAGTAKDVYKIRAAYPKAFPQLADKFPTEVFGINNNGRVQVMASVQTVTNGKSDPSSLYVWWPNTQQSFLAAKKASRSDKRTPYIWLRTAN